MTNWACAKGHTEGKGSNGTCKVCHREYVRGRYPALAEEIKRRAIAWNRTNAARRKEILRAYAVRNRAALKARRAELYDPAADLAKCRLRQAAKLRRTPAWADRARMAAIYRDARRLTIETGIQHHVDHDLPLQGLLVCGLHVHQNLKIITASANLSKGRRFDPEAT